MDRGGHGNPQCRCGNSAGAARPAGRCEGTAMRGGRGPPSPGAGTERGRSRPGAEGERRGPSGTHHGGGGGGAGGRRAGAAAGPAPAAPRRAVGEGSPGRWRRVFSPAGEFREFSRRQLLWGTGRGGYDAGKDGFIDLMELKLMMEKLGAPQTHLGLKNMIKEVDEDLDSKLSFREFLLIFRKAAAGELQEDSGLHALARLSEIDVSTEGVKGAKNFFEAKAQAINEASRFEEEIKAEQEEKKKQAEELKQRKAAFKELQSTFTQ
uniref:EF-hand domain family member D2 n=1 Tax=Malurus cyaneus samueli TaxID=2593467 RepID=A0A8C5U1B4_9PASS